MLEFSSEPIKFVVEELSTRFEKIRYENDLEAVLMNPSFDTSTGFGDGFIQLRHFQLNRKAWLAHYAYTGRSMAYLMGTNPERRKYFPDWFFSPAFLRGKVMDIDCGWGALVSDLRLNGINAYGTDLYLPQALRSRNYLLQTIFEGSNLQDSQFNVMFSTWGAFYFENDDVKVIKRLRLARTLLANGGDLLITPVRKNMDRLAELAGGFSRQKTDPDFYPTKPEWHYIHLKREY